MLLLLFILIFWNIYPSTIQSEASNLTIASFFKNETIDYIINEDTICSISGPNILIAVHSSPKNTHKRNLIRNSYGAFKRINDQTVGVVFIVGRTTDGSVDRDIRTESKHYRDIIQPDFIDSYRNLTLKHVALLNWVDIYCSNASHFIKVDDDTIIDIFHLDYFLRTYDLTNDLYCKAIHTHVLRWGKWAVSKEEYPNDYYPPYCEGFAYILANLRKLSQMVEYALNEKFFWIDDVFLLGTVRQKVNMTLQYFPHNFGYSNIMESSKSDSINFIFFRNGNNEYNDALWEDVWKSILVNSMELYE